MKICRAGISRIVILIGGVAIKFPRINYGWQKFLHGLLCNLNERTWWRLTDGDDRLCPVLFAMWGGWFLVMRRAEAFNPAGEYAPNFGIFKGFPCEMKDDSFGWIDGRLVCIDYGDNFGKYPNDFGEEE